MLLTKAHPTDYYFLLFITTFLVYWDEKNCSTHIIDFNIIGAVSIENPQINR